MSSLVKAVTGQASRPLLIVAITFFAALTTSTVTQAIFIMSGTYTFQGSMSTTSTQKPGLNNTGPTDPSILVARGSLVITQTGTIVENVDISGTIRIEADNVTIRNFRLNGGGTHHAIRANNGNIGIVIEDGEIYNAGASVVGSGLTLRRLYIHHITGSAFHLYGDSLLEDSWLHHVGTMGLYIPDGSNIIVRQNFFDLSIHVDEPYASGSAIMAITDRGPIDNVKIDQNWLNGGNVIVYIREKDFGLPTRVQLTNNRFGRDFRYSPTSTDGTHHIAGNIWDDTHELMAINNAGFRCSQVSEIPETECNALTVLYNGMDGPSWTANEGWLTTNTPCSWFGVTCTDGRVTTLALVRNNLTGVLPGDLKSLRNLITLDLEGNHLSGEIPVDFVELSSLNYLGLGDNQLTGTIPSVLGDLVRLKGIWLDRNQLTGSIPSELGNLSNLNALHLSYNLLDGPIPSTLGNLSKLHQLHLDNNQLSGTLPIALFNLEQLEFLSLGDNLLRGPIPPEIEQLPRLKLLDLSSNLFTGALPAQLGNLPQLLDLFLGINQFEGAIPYTVGQLTALQQLYLNGNLLTGTLPSELGSLTALDILSVNDNPLQGPLPNSLTDLTALDGFFFQETNLCVPNDAAFQTWLANLPSTSGTGIICTSVTPTATPSPTSTLTPTPTPTSTPASGDAYETDDACHQANSLVLNGNVQVHTFHQPGDMDWFSFTVQASTRYTLTAHSTSTAADLALEIYATCAEDPFVSDQDSLGSDAQLVFTAATSGTYYARVYNYDPSAYGADVTYEMGATMGSLPGAVLIVAGHEDNFRLQENILYATNLAYRTFLNSGIPKANIRYLSSIDEPKRTDADGDQISDVYDTSASANVEAAITTWAANLVNASSPLYIYLIDHGVNDAFLNYGRRDTMTSDELDGWLETLEAATNAPIIVIYEACRSGSFIAQPSSISKPGRVVITTTGSQNNAYAVRGRGAYFSDAFFTALAENHDFYAAFEWAHNAVRATQLWQTPWLDDNGDAQFNEQDGQRARQINLSGFNFAGQAPIIEQVQGPTVIQQGEGAIRTQVSGLNIARVWVEIYPPWFVEPPPSEDGVMPDLNLPQVVLSDSDDDGEYIGIYEDFTMQGIYRFVVYAEDDVGNLAQPLTLGFQLGSQILLPLIMH